MSRDDRRIRSAPASSSVRIAVRRVPVRFNVGREDPELYEAEIRYLDETSMIWVTVGRATRKTRGEAAAAARELARRKSYVVDESLLRWNDRDETYLRQLRADALEFGE